MPEVLVLLRIPPLVLVWAEGLLLPVLAGVINGEKAEDKVTSEDDDRETADTRAKDLIMVTFDLTLTSME